MDVGGLGAVPVVASSHHSATIRGVARILDVAIVLSGLAALALSIAGARAPHFVVAIAPAAVSSDGGHAYVFAPGFAPHWPYAVPSHPHDVLAQGDVAVLEDGRPIGTLDPSHADIRERGGGLHNLWDGALWFSPSDDGDPRTNGRDYRLVVRGRLAPSAAAAQRWSLPFGAVLLLIRLALAARLLPMRRWGRGLGRIRCGAWSRVVRATPILPRVWDAASRIPLTFGRTYALVGSTVLAAFVWEVWTRPAPFVSQADSFGYIFPGLVWASGGDTTGVSIRDIGYPALTLLAVRLGSLATLPRIQLVLVVLGMACLLGSLYLALSLAAQRLERVAAVPRSISALPAAAAAVALVALLTGHDLFVIDIESAMAEAPHLLPTALALLLFLAAWIVRAGRSSVILLMFASLAAYGSALFKPHTLVVIALCMSSLVYKGLRSRRHLWSPGLVGCGALVLFAALGLHRFDARITPAGADFGPRTLFCNRLDVILPVFDVSTPTRQRIAGMMRDIMSDVGGWPLMGYSGDRCVYNSDMQKVISLAAEEENASPAQWMQREFLKGVLKNPLRYTHDAWIQAVHFFQTPVVDMNISVTSDLSLIDENRYAVYASLINMPRQAWTVTASNWMPEAYPRAASLAKLWLAEVAKTFPSITLLATAIATIVLATVGRRWDCRLETVVVATAAFTAAFIGTIVLSHSFDIGRYATDVLPISLLWWFVSAAYLVHLAVLTAAFLFRKGAA